MKQELLILILVFAIEANEKDRKGIPKINLVLKKSKCFQMINTYQPKYTSALTKYECNLKATTSSLSFCSISR